MLFDVADRVKNLERAFVVREGITRENDTFSERTFDHPLQSGPNKGKVLKLKEFEKMKDKYYVLRGWDVKTGIPTGETLEKSGLDHAANELRELGKLPENRTLEHPGSDQVEKKIAV